MLKEILEKAYKQENMQWRVYSFDPEKDNKLVYTSKAFDCIADAQVDKVEQLKKHPNYIVEISTSRVIESSQKNENFGPNDIVPQAKQMDFKKQYLKGKDARKVNKNSFYFDGVNAVDDNTGSNIPGAKLGMKYKELAGALDKFFLESANIDVKNPGVLEVPDGKKVNELPQSHFEKLVDKKGYAEVIRALTNLEVWNKDKNKSLSSWASNMADKLKKKFRPESAQKNEDDYVGNDKYIVIPVSYANKDIRILDKRTGEFLKDKQGKNLKFASANDCKKYINSLESAQKNEDVIPAIHDSLIIRYKDKHDKADFDAIVKMLKELLKKASFITFSDIREELKGWRYSKDDINKIIIAIGGKPESAQKNESKINMSKLKNEIQAAIKAYFKNDKDILDYIEVDTGKDSIEVRAELGYSSMVKLADYLDKIIRKYDKDAYFDQVDGGIMMALFESAQKNEAKLDKGYDINFDNVGCGFEVIQAAVSGSLTSGYGIELSGYSNNNSKRLTFVHPTLSNDKGLTQDERREHYDGLNAKRTAIARDLKPLADKFDKDVEAVFAKHGFKKA